MTSKIPLGKLPASAFGHLTLPRLVPELIEAYRALDDLTGQTSDAMDQLGIIGVVPGSTLRPTDPKARIVGQALTVCNVQVAETVAERVAGKVSGLGDIEAHNLAEPGDVLVVQGVPGVSSMGGIMATVAKRSGEIGAIVDGAVRDIDHSRAIGYPVWSSSVSPMTGKWRIRTVGINVPVVIAGVPVAPGDLVLADEVGVCFIPFARAAEVLAVAQRIGESETARPQTARVRHHAGRIRQCFTDAQVIRCTPRERGRLAPGAILRPMRTKSAGAPALIKLESIELDIVGLDDGLPFGFFVAMRHTKLFGRAG